VAVLLSKLSCGCRSAAAPRQVDWKVRGGSAVPAPKRDMQETVLFFCSETQQAANLNHAGSR